MTARLPDAILEDWYEDRITIALGALCNSLEDDGPLGAAGEASALVRFEEAIKFAHRTRVLALPVLNNTETKT